MQQDYKVQKQKGNYLEQNFELNKIASILALDYCLTFTAITKLFGLFQ